MEKKRPFRLPCLTEGATRHWRERPNEKTQTQRQTPEGATRHWRNQTNGAIKAPRQAHEGTTRNWEEIAKKKTWRSSWTGKRAGQKEDDESDFLSNLGSGQDYNINVSHGKHGVLVV